ncbi:hypothetical protein B0I22_0921 [Epilithonimonas xixisoli]|uniref:Uncharacterized protein n=1 Tax=Epilithonimonas xixisoli TaxID=1476462 RepID=A0A4V3H2X5_9FLAO|nr:hypothetical protein B0I22_0921 [Epilithonimonas xixisoli]
MIKEKSAVFTLLTFLFSKLKEKIGDLSLNNFFSYPT